MWSSKWSTSISKAWPPSWSHQGSRDCLANPTLSMMHGSTLVLIAFLFAWSKTPATTETSPPVGQAAHYGLRLLNIQRGYASVPLAWAGRVATPPYNVGRDRASRTCE